MSTHESGHATGLNIHGVAVRIGRCGVLIEGPSGAGKTTLAFELVDRVRARGGHAAFIADDRCLLEARHGRLIARPPGTIAGLAELHGFGVVGVPHARAGIIDLVVRLVAPEAAERLPGPSPRTLCGVSLPGMDVVIQQARSNARCVLAHPALAIDPS